MVASRRFKDPLCLQLREKSMGEQSSLPLGTHDMGGAGRPDIFGE